MEYLSEFGQFAPHLANPLVLVGFVLLLVFGVHRTLLKAGILRPVSEQQSSHVVKLILKYGFYIAILTLVCGFLYAALQTYLTAAVVRHSELSLVDLTVDDNGRTVDFKLKNTGLDSAFITQVSFAMYLGDGILTTCMPVGFVVYDYPFSVALQDQLAGKRASMSLRVSLPPPLQKQIAALDAADYAKEMSETKSPDPNQKKPTEPLKAVTLSPAVRVAQEVPPTGVDRFKIRFDPEEGSDKGVGCGWTETYPARAIIRYDRDKQLVSDVFFIRIRGLGEVKKSDVSEACEQARANGTAMKWNERDKKYDINPVCEK